MRIPPKYRAIKNSIITFALIGFGLPWMVMVIAFTRQGDLPSERYNQFIEIAFKAANWPSFLLRIYPVTEATMNRLIDVWWLDLLYNVLVNFVNIIGWGIVGFVAGLVIVAIRSRKKKRK